MGLDDYAQALGAAQRLVPNWRQNDLQEAQLQGARLNNQIGQVQLDDHAKQVAYVDQRRSAFQAALQQLGAKPTPQAYRALGAQFPEFHDALDGAAQGLDGEQSKALVRRLAPIQAQIANKQYTGAAAELKRHMDADKAAGLPVDEDDQHLYDELTSGDTARQQGAGGIVYGLLASLDPKNAAENIGKVTNSDNANHFSTAGDGVIYDLRTGAVVREGSAKPEYKTVDVYDADGTKIGERVIALGGTGGGGPVSGGGGAAGGSGAPRSVRNNNPGNIRYGAFAKSKGATGSDDAGYAIFPSQDAGSGAQAALLGGKGYFGGGRKTVASIIEKWAPRASKGGDNTDAQVNNYIKYVAGKLNVNPADTLTPAVLPRMAQAMAEFEGGHTGQAGATRMGGSSVGGGNVVYESVGAPGAKASGDLSGDALERAAAVYMQTGQMPTGLGRQGITQRAILNKAAEIAKAGGVTPEQQIANWQNNKTAQQALNAFARGPEARTVRSLNVTIDHLDTLQNAAQALQNGNIPLFNKVRQGWARATGSAVPTNFEGVRQIVSAEVAKAITGGPTALADRQDLVHGIATSNSPQQLAGYIAEVKKLMAGQLDGLAGQYKAGTGRDDFASRLSPRTKRALGYDRPTAPTGFRILSRRPK